MAMYKYGSAVVVEPSISQDNWYKNKESWKVECDENECHIKTAKTIIAKYVPEKYLLSHATIIAAVETELAKSNDPKSDYYIHPAYSKFINNNGDAWSKKMVQACYRTFIGADNFFEHVQVPELSKGKVVDAVLREVPIGKDKNGEDLTTFYVDILVATDRKHKDLVRKIESKEVDKMSMGCFVSGTEITMANGTKKNIEEVQPGDMVITHSGNIKPVMHVQKRWHEGIVHAIKVEGDYKTTYVTSEHPFWAFKKKKLCACGCGEEVDVKITGDRIEDGCSVYSRYKLGHYARVVNPNKKTYSIKEYKEIKENNSIKEKMSLSWIEAENLRLGDLVSYPVSKIVIDSEDATVEKARLIGYFLAEGSFIKEVVVKGEENDYGVRCRICGNLYNMIGTHLPVHKINLEEYKKLYPDAPTSAKIRKKLIRTKSRNDDLNIEGLTRTRKKVGIEFSLGEHEKSTVNKEICELTEKVFPKATVLRYDKCVKVISEEVAQFFEKYCGEYFDNKILPQEVLYWNQDIQKHLVATWIIGDLNTTGSKNLANQLRFILNRLKVINNHLKQEKTAYKTELKKKTADGSIVTEYYEGIRSECYIVQINYQGFNVLERELNYAFKFKIPQKYLDVSDWGKHLIEKNWRNSHKFNNIIRPIKSYENIPYEGWVYNFSVKDDESYLANDIAVHNCKVAFTICTKCGNIAKDDTEACEHVRYEKNNVFYDEYGTQRKIAELCGRYDQPDSVVFIDASWVANPAFTGAVVRNVVNPPENIMAKIEEANKKESYEYKEGDLLRAAYKKSQEEKPPEEEPPAEEPAPEDEPAETPEEEPPTEEPAPEPAPEESQNSVQVWKKRIKERLLRELGDEMVQEFEETEPAVDQDLESLDDTLIQPTASHALKQMYKMKKSWDEYLHKFSQNLNKKNFDKLKFGTYMVLTGSDLTSLVDYGYNKRDFLAVMSFIDTCFKKPLSVKIKKAVAELGGTQGLSYNGVVFALQKLAGTRLSDVELKRSLTWLKLLDSYPN